MKVLFRNFAKSFVNNLGTIIKAAVFSLFIWFFISIQIFPDITLHVSDIKIVCEPTPFMIEENLQIVSVDTQNVTIQIQGKRYDISGLSSEDFAARCDLSGVYESGEHYVPINVTPEGDTRCEILSRQMSAKVKVVKIVSREMSVIPNTNLLDIAEEMQVEGDVTVSPSVVTITGEEHLVNSIGRVEAVASYGDPLDRTSEVPASLVYFNNYSAKMVDPDVSVSDSNFLVNVPVYKVKTLPVRVKFTNTTASGTSFDISRLKYSMSINEITIASPDNSIDNIDAIDIEEFSLGALTLKDLQGGISIPVKLPDGYKNISGNKTITVSFPDFDSYGQLGFTVPSENISIINAPSNYDVKVLTNELLVNVVGLSNYIQEMTSDDIYATVNLLGVELSEGTKSVSVTFRLSGSNVRAWVTGEEYKVELMVTSSAPDEQENE